VQDWAVTDPGEWRSVTGVAQGEGCIADLDPAARAYGGTKSGGDELSAETDSQGGPVGIESAGQQLELVVEERVLREIADTDGATENDEQIGGRDALGTQVVDAGINIADRVPSLAQQRVQQAEVLEGDVADRDS